LETKVRYLVDTDIWLERLLDQAKSEIVSNFLNTIPSDQLYVSDFAIHSIGVILSRLKKLDTLKMFLEDLFINGQIEQLALDTIDLLDVLDNITKYGLDFDDSYQYTVSEKYDLTLVSFDKDFNVKGLRKVSPEDITKNK
jgi:predicted nucleic acid-binding protein